MLLKILPSLLLALALSACVGPRVMPELPANGVELTDTPFHPQERYQCGPAALATVLQKAGVDTSPDALVNQVWLPDRQGSLQLELVAATRRHERVAYVIAPELRSLLAEVQAGRPVLVMQNLGTSWYPVWHFAVVIGFEPERGRILLRSGTTERQGMSLRRFLRSWELAESWAMVALPADELPADPDRRRYLAALADLESTGRPVLAASGYRAWLAQAPQDALALFGLANSHLALDEPEAAEEVLLRLLEVRPGDAAASNNLARLLLTRGCATAARRVLAKIAEPVPPGLQEAVSATRTLAADSADAACQQDQGAR
ncbi:MAG: PA2778 family cysteine peptidase [Gammaproteobacteria bacterium]|nr:PA2778 family cysteine peptidase [Gammaproteobacteria bacterium]